MTRMSLRPGEYDPLWTGLLSITCQDRATGVRLMTWRSREQEIDNGQCVLAYSALATRRWCHLADLVVCTAGTVPADERAKAMFDQLPGCLLVVIEDPDRRVAVLWTKKGQRDVVTETGADLERRAALAYAWISVGRPLTTMP
jgi:hypothetical protein